MIDLSSSDNSNELYLKLFKNKNLKKKNPKDKKPKTIINLYSEDDIKSNFYEINEKYSPNNKFKNKNVKEISFRLLNDNYNKIYSNLNTEIEFFQLNFDVAKNMKNYFVHNNYDIVLNQSKNYQKRRITMGSILKAYTTNTHIDSIHF